jgi:peroxiredoxin
MKSIASLAILLVLALPLRAQTADTSSLTKVGQTVPNFRFTTLDGKTLSISELRGKVVLVNFFATWCDPCMTEMPRVEKEIWQAFRGDKFMVLAIGREHSAAELMKFNKEKGFTFPIAPDPKRGIYSLFATQYIPRTYVIGRTGAIIYQSMGYHPEEFGKMVERIKSELKQPSQP